jgi:hypothetical protein
VVARNREVEVIDGRIPHGVETEKNKTVRGGVVWGQRRRRDHLGPAQRRVDDVDFSLTLPVTTWFPTAGCDRRGWLPSRSTSSPRPAKGGEGDTYVYSTEMGRGRPGCGCSSGNTVLPTLPCFEVRDTLWPSTEHMCGCKPGGRDTGRVGEGDGGTHRQGVGQGWCGHMLRRQGGVCETRKDHRGRIGDNDAAGGACGPA